MQKFGSAFAVSHKVEVDLVTEAGGRVTDFNGRPLDIYGKECLASNGRFHEEMTSVLQRGTRPT
jgi:myo-inositol-1(or 4)-monophosphatase